MIAKIKEFFQELYCQPNIGRRKRTFSLGRKNNNLLKTRACIKYAKFHQKIAITKFFHGRNLVRPGLPRLPSRPLSRLPSGTASETVVAE